MACRRVVGNAYLDLIGLSLLLSIMGTPNFRIILLSVIGTSVVLRIIDLAISGARYDDPAWTNREYIDERIEEVRKRDVAGIDF